MSELGFLLRFQPPAQTSTSDEAWKLLEFAREHPGVWIGDVMKHFEWTRSVTYSRIAVLKRHGYVHTVLTKTHRVNIFVTDLGRTASGPANFCS